MNMLEQKLQGFTQQLLKPRKYNYSQDCLYTFLQSHTSFKINSVNIKNKRNELIDAMVIKGMYSDTCIIYAHGLGSNKLEILPLVQSLGQCGYHFCAFDFSGSGRSEGKYTTFGLREQDDINAVLTWLDTTRVYNRYILWGRSMGGAAIVLSQSRNLNKKVQCIVLDSPFCSFERAAIQIASKNTVFPQLMLNLVIEPFKQQIKKIHPTMNPFDMDITKAVSLLQTRILLIYSKNDSLVSWKHSKQIGKSCKKDAVEIEIQEDHNKPRKRETFAKVLKFIVQSMDMCESRAKRSASKGRGISVSSKQNSSCAQNKNKKQRMSINKSISKFRYSEALNMTQNLVSIGSFSSQIRSPKGLKQAFIRSVVLEKQGMTGLGDGDSFGGGNMKQSIQRTVKINHGKYRNCGRLL